jgi:LysR family hydrogen peroxide-inducible transcriptional activator
MAQPQTPALISNITSRTTFHRAALHCHVSQSTLSTAIQDLKEQFGYQLLERDHKTFVFMPFG